jgi:hypothetical protein
VLDPEGLGYITTARMKEMLTTHGTTPFRDKEVEGE